jgi:hypothetical protein
LFLVFLPVDHSSGENRPPSHMFKTCHVLTLLTMKKHHAATASVL